MTDFKSLIIAMIAAMAILAGWQYFYEMPKMKEYEKQANIRTKNAVIHNSKRAETQSSFVDIAEGLGDYKSRVIIEGDKLSGSISIVGARIDDLILTKYHKSDYDDSLVRLLNPSKTQNAYFSQFGWVSKSQNLQLPDSDTVWSADKKKIKSGDSVKLTWTNNQGITFQIKLTLDENYMFTVEKTVKNRSGNAIVLQEYSLVNRIFEQNDKKFAISHEGPVGVFNGILDEVSYEDLTSKHKLDFDNNKQGSWFGVSDKYWLTAIIPDQGQSFNATFQHSKYSGKDRYQVGYLGEDMLIASGSEESKTSYFFAGAKVVSILDAYGKNLNLKLFDRAVDFGWFYFITKPMFFALKFFYDLVGNFGVSILIVTVIVKMFLFPLANKSYYSMLKMKKLAPEMTRIKELYPDDKVKQNQATMELYKKEKVSPLSGCLPLLIQIPIFFSLYKVLFITIEMRQAPFFGWIKDLSMPDPTTIFNLFGLIPLQPPSFLMIGAWPIIMAVTMYVQQSMSPEPSDPIQAKVMKFLPLIFLFMFASFPAGLVIYWAWGNILSIAQQYFIKINASRKENIVI